MEKVRNFLSLNSSPDYTITGNFPYHLEVSVKGDSPYQTSTLSITAFTKSDKKLAIAIACKWYRIHEDRQYLMATIHSNTYQLSAEDIGYTLKVEVTSQEEDQSGVANVHYGPIRIDPNVRSTLENILGAGGSRFPIQLVDEETGLMSKEPASLSMTSEYVRIVETPPIGKEKEVKFQYSYDMPKIELNYLDGSRMYYMFTGEEEDCEAVKKFIGYKKSGPCKLGVKFLSRTARDLVILALKCFATKTNLGNSMLINAVAFNPGKIFKEKRDAQQQLGDLLFEVDSIKREMYLVLLRNQELGKDKERLQRSVKGLEEDLARTIETSGQLLAEVRSGDVSQSSEAAGEYKRKAEKLEDETKKLRRRIQEMEDERIYAEKMGGNTRRSVKPGKENVNVDYDKIRQDFESLSMQKEEQNMFSLEYEMKITELEEENQKLKVRNENLGEELRQVKMQGGMDSARGTIRGRPTVHDESLLVIESKISDTKKLNELLIKQVNDQKAKNGSLQKELEMLRDQVTRLQGSENGVMDRKEKMYQEQKGNLEKEILALRGENERLLKTGGPGSQEMGQLKRRLDELQKENNELRVRNVGMEKSRVHEVSILGDRSMLLESSQIFGTPRKEYREDVAQQNLNQQFAQRFKMETESLIKDLGMWKSRCSGLEIEAERIRKENQELKASNMGSSRILGSPGKEDLMQSFERSMTSTSKTYEAIMVSTKKENDALHVEIANLKTRLSVADYGLQSAKIELERVKNSGVSGGNVGSGEEVMKLRKEVEVLRGVNEKLKREVTPQEKEMMLRERDHLRAEVDALKRGVANDGRLKELEGRVNEKTREVDVLKADIENWKAKNGSLVKEIEYLRGEVNSLRRTDESILGVSGIMGLNEYKGKYERLLEEYNKMEKEFGNYKKNVKKAGSQEDEDVHQINELLRKEILEYKKKLERKDSGDGKEQSDEEVKKRNRMLEAEVQNQRLRISDLEKENERLRLSGNVRNPSEESFISSRGGKDEALSQEVERLKVENESLLQQRNQLSKKVEGLGKELESKTGVKTNQAMLENLTKLNDKLLQENLKLMDQVRSLNDELEAAKYGSRMESSRLDDSRFDDVDIKDRFTHMQNELSMVNAEKDKLLVELSKFRAMEQNKRFLF